MKTRNLGGFVILGLMGLLGAVALAAVFIVMTYITYANLGTTNEVNLKSTWTNNQNISGQCTLKVQEVAQIPEVYKDDLKDVVTSEMESRYGESGSKAMFNFIQERALNFDASLYAKVQQVMEACRNEFSTAQTRLIDQKAQYEAQLGYVWSGFWLKLAGFPKVDLAIYKPVVAGSTAQEFESGVAAPIKIR